MKIAHLMEKPPTFSPAFARRLSQDGFLLNEVDKMTTNSQKPFKALKRLTDYSNQDLQNCFFNPERDQTLPLIIQAITNTLSPWIKTSSTDFLPTNLTIGEISRQSNIDPRKIIRLINTYQPQINIGDKTFSLELQDAPINRKRAIKNGRYFSRSPGGGPVQKSGLQKKRLDKATTSLINTKKRIILKSNLYQKKTLSPSQPKIQEKTYYWNQALELGANPDKITNILNAINWFKQGGSPRSWLLGSQSLLTSQLIELSKGKPIEFVIWNCIGFEWIKTKPGKYPSCNILDNLDALITYYFKDQIQQVTQVLSTIGNPKITILIPSQEVLDDRVWEYNQPLNERQALLDRMTTGIDQQVCQLTSLPNNCTLQVKRWDEFLKERNITTSTDEYSILGEQAIRQSADFEAVLQEAVQSGVKYFDNLGIRVTPESMAKSRPPYYGTYAGEGFAYQDIKTKTGKSIIVINFEELRCAQMARRGAQAAGYELTVLTPIKAKQMAQFYKWENEIVKNRPTT